MAALDVTSAAPSRLCLRLEESHFSDTGGADIVDALRRNCLNGRPGTCIAEIRAGRAGSGGADSLPPTHCWGPVSKECALLRFPCIGGQESTFFTSSSQRLISLAS